MTTTKVASVGTKIFLGSHQASCLWEPNYLEVHTVRGFKYCHIMKLCNSFSHLPPEECHCVPSSATQKFPCSHLPSLHPVFLKTSMIFLFLIKILLFLLTTSIFYLLQVLLKRFFERWTSPPSQVTTAPSASPTASPSCSTAATPSSPPRGW